MDKTTAMSLIIEHLMAGNTFDANKVVRLLASNNPVLLVELTGIGSKESSPVTVGWQAVTIAAIAEGNRVEAIKTVRVAFRMGLREAKDAVDYFMGMYTSHTTWDSLSLGGQQAVDALRVYTGRLFY